MVQICRENETIENCERIRTEHIEMCLEHTTLLIMIDCFVYCLDAPKNIMPYLTCPMQKQYTAAGAHDSHGIHCEMERENNQDSEHRATEPE